MIQVREAVLSDVPFIVDAQIAMAKETENLVLIPEIVQSGVTAVFRDRAKGLYLVVSHDHEVIACALTVPEWSDWRNGTVLWIHSVYVHEAFRRQGVFNALYTYLKEKVSEDASLRGLRLYVDKTNAGARNAYEAVGMSNEHYELFEWMKA